MCVLHTYVDRPRKKRLRRSAIRLVEDSNCMHACQTLLMLMDMSSSSLQVLNKKSSYISAAVFCQLFDTAVMITTFTCYTKPMHADPSAPVHRSNRKRNMYYMSTPLFFDILSVREIFVYLVS